MAAFEVVPGCKFTDAYQVGDMAVERLESGSRELCTKVYCLSWAMDS